MSEIVGKDTVMYMDHGSRSRITRIYVWYPTQEAGEDWANDPAIQHVLEEIWTLPVESVWEPKWITLEGHPYYWHKYATGCVWVICRVFYGMIFNGEDSIPFPEPGRFSRPGNQSPPNGRMWLRENLSRR